MIEFYEDAKTELYNLRDDIYEQKDLSAKYPEKADRLLQLLRKKQKETGALLPQRRKNVP